MRPRTAIAALLILAFAAVIAALLRGTSLPLIAGPLERSISEALGRPVTLAQAPWIKLGAESRLRIRDLRIANPSWAGPEPFLSLGEAQVTLDLASVFSGPILIDEVNLAELHVRLATDAAGISNLPVLKDDEESAEDEESDKQRRFLVRTVRGRNLSLQRLDGVTGEDLRLFIDRLEQGSPSPERIALSAAGRLQDRPWTLEAEHSGLQSLIRQTGLEGSLTGELGNLQLRGAYRLDDVTHLENLQGDLELKGSVPPRIAELSPLLDTETPLLATLQVRDIDPGITVAARIEAGSLTFTAEGVADDPGRRDGVDLDMALFASSLPRLARALGLGATEEVALNIAARVRRDGRHVVLESLLVQAQEHRIEGRANFPFFPGTTDADLDLQIKGPNFAFYQRLFDRPFRVEQPYSALVSLKKVADGREEVRFDGTIGSVDVDLQGFLGGFPSYRNSDITLSARSDQLSELGAVFDVKLPAVPLDLDGRLRVSNEGIVEVQALSARAAGAELRASGHVDTYPELDDLDARITLTTDSLGASLRALDYGDAGDVPASLETRATGALAEIEFGDIILRAGASSLRSTAGALRVQATGLESDLELLGSLQGLDELLATDSPRGLGDRAIRFSLSPRIAPDYYAVRLSELDAPGVSGDANFRIGRDLALDGNALLEADLRIDDPRQVIPDFEGYTPPDNPLGLRARTRGGSGELSLTLTSDDVEVLSADVAPRGEDGDFVLKLSGKGEDLRVLGTNPRLPAGTLPFAVNAEVRRESDDLDVTVEELRVGATQASGTASWRATPARLVADIDLQRADLDAWFAREASDVETPDAPPPARGARLIPDTPVAVEFLENRDLDIRMRTGTLGLTDPLAAGLELVDATDLHLTNANGKARLQINDVRGSRGLLKGSVDLIREDEGVAVSADLDLSDLPIGITSAGTSLGTMPLHDVTLDFRSRGATWQALAANLDGDLLVSGGRGVLQNMGLSFATESFIRQLLSTLLPVDRDEDRVMQVQCTVLAARAESGVVLLNPGFIMRTSRVDLSARGSIDLNTERLAVRFDNQARKGLGISAGSLVNPYVQISGTLARPSLGLDVAGSAIAGGAAMASGGLTVLAKPLFGRFLDRRNPCQVALKRWEELKGA